MENETRQTVEVGYTLSKRTCWGGLSIYRRYLTGTVLSSYTSWVEHSHYHYYHHHIIITPLPPPQHHHDDHHTTTTTTIFLLLILLLLLFITIIIRPRGFTFTWWGCYGLWFNINQPSLPTPFYTVLVPFSVFMAFSTVFHSINPPDNSPLSHSALPVLFLPYRSFQLYISL